MANRGGKPILQSFPSENQGGIHIYQELRVTGAKTDPDYNNQNPWAGILGRANETDVKIDGVISEALIDSGAMILMMSKDYCHERGYEIQLLEHLVSIESSGGSVPYLGYVRVRMCILLALILLIGMSSCSLALLQLNTIKGYQSR